MYDPLGYEQNLILKIDGNFDIEWSYIQGELIQRPDYTNNVLQISDGTLVLSKLC